MEKQQSFFSPISSTSKKLTSSPKTESLAPLSEKKTSVADSSNTANKQVFSIFIDGAARGNPGESGAGIFIALNGKDLLKKGFYLGTKTNNQAEYLALALALLLFHEFLAKHNVKPSLVSFFSDSELLVKQMNHTYKTKNPILKQLQAFIATQLKHTHYTFTHVMREKNKIADKLANQGVDQKIPPPSSYQKLLSQYGLLF